MSRQQTVVYKTPKFAPLPGEITNERVNNAILPAQIEAATRAIALCESLPQLLVYREQAEGLAAAVKIMKKTAPDMVRSANNMVADAWQKGGELLEQYSNVSPRVGMFIPKLGRIGQIAKRGPTERTEIAKKLGLSSAEVAHMARFARASTSEARAAAQKTSSLFKAAGLVPRVNKGGLNRSDALRRILTCGAGQGVTGALCAVRNIDMADVRSLAPDEKKLVRAKVTEIMELLDKIDEACK